MKRLFVLLVLICASSYSAFCQLSEEASPVEEGTGDIKKFGIKRLVNYLKAHELSGVDTSYIGVPKRKWTVFANGYFTDMDFDLRSNALSNESAGYDQKIGKVSIDMYSKLEKQLSVGLYWMGYGLGYSFNLGKGFNKDLSLTMYSSPVGGEIRFHSTNRISGKIAVKGMGVELDIGEQDAKMENFILNAYYVFNPKRFSYGAAMSYSKIQKKSAGSVLAGLTVNRTRLTAYDIVLASLMGGVNKINIQQISLGAGYGYNWVPVKGLTVHLSEIPMVLITTKSATKASGDWSDTEKDRQKKLFGNKTHISFSHMFRTSVSYGWNDRFQAGVSGYYNYFRVGRRSSYFASMEDWSARFFFAVRF
ncbi:MAG: DUF4421 family protein [Bacteroidales bacterium]|nr:DUF4421 family protein [Bacteroidales bacterium]